MRIRRPSPWPFFVLLFVLTPFGCRREEITHYRVPKELAGVEARPEQRMLAAMLPHGDRVWFLKLLGPKAVVDAHAEEFEQFLRSVRFSGQDNEPITWTTPTGWTKEQGPPGRFATFRIGTNDDSAEFTLTSLGREASSVLANVNRWRGQLGLTPLAESELASSTRELKLDADSATLVDLTGRAGSGPMMKPPFMATRPPEPAVDPGPARGAPRYQTPPGWEKPEKPARMSIVTFNVREGNRVVEVTVIPLPGEAGGLLANVNRWRNQIRLEPTTEDQLKADVRKLEVAGTSVPYVDLIGPPGPDRQRLLAVSLEHGPETWFFKMKGPADLVGGQQAAFEAFMKSVRFDAGQGDN